MIPLQKLIIYVTLILAMLHSTDLWGTHNRAGEIQFEQLGPLSIRATVITYTKASSAP